jgi:hypothetical protein
MSNLRSVSVGFVEDRAVIVSGGADGSQRMEALAGSDVMSHRRRVRLPGKHAGQDFEADHSGDRVVVGYGEDAWREWQANCLANGIHRIAGIEDMARARGANEADAIPTPSCAFARTRHFGDVMCAAETQGEEECRRKSESYSCIDDEGRPLGIGFQEQVPNQPELLR